MRRAIGLPVSLLEAFGVVAVADDLKSTYMLEHHIYGLIDVAKSWLIKRDLSAEQFGDVVRVLAVESASALAKVKR